MRGGVVVSFQEKLSLKRIINAAGKLTALGGSTVSADVARALAEAAQVHVRFDELLVKSGEYIAKLLGAEDAVATTGAAAGIAISVAACITGTDLAKIRRLPLSSGRNEVVLMKGQAVDFGAPVVSMIRLGGGVPVEVGLVNSCSKAEIEDAITEKTAAFLYVKSHHTVQKGMVSLEECINIAHARGIPIIIDAAAEEDLWKYPVMGIDLAIFSGSKAILGPTSGFICGRKDLIEACRMQYRGIGRPMKIGKEGIIGLIAALEAYRGVDEARAARLMQKAQWMAEALRNIPGVKTSVVQDEAGRAIYRTEVRIDKAVTGISAFEVIKSLEDGDPAIYTRNHYANIGIILLDPRPLAEGEEKIVVERLREVLTSRP